MPSFPCIYITFSSQVKELEKIVRRRAHPNFSNVSDIIKNYDSKGYEKDSETMINLKKELLEKQHVIIELKNQLVETKVFFICFIYFSSDPIIFINLCAAKYSKYQKNQVSKSTLHCYFSYIFIF